VDSAAADLAVVAAASAVADLAADSEAGDDIH
jgi:hypothetical protein